MSSYIKSEPELRMADMLQCMKCPLLGNGEAWWINELFFKPGSHRFQLFDWIFTKMGFEEILSEYFKSKTEKDYLEILSEMAVCNAESDMKFVTGDMSKKEQLPFWNTILNMVYINVQLDSEVSTPTEEVGKLSLLDSQSNNNASRCQIKENSNEDQTILNSGNDNFVNDVKHKSPESDEGSVFLTPKPIRNLDTEYEKCVNFINNISKNVSVPDLFLKKCFVLPPDIEKDIDRILAMNEDSVTKLPDTKLSIPVTSGDNSLLIPNKSDGKLHSTLTTEGTSIEEDSSSTSASSVECEKVTAVADFQKVMKQFTDTYNELKPVLQSSSATSSNFGAEFEKTYPQMELFSKIMSHLDKTKSINDILEKESSSLQKFDLSDFNLTGSELENYITVLQGSLLANSKDS